MIQYLFEPRRKTTIKKLIKILGTKSASESIKSILTVSSDIVDNYPEIRSEFCMELLTELNECNDNEDKCECIANIFQTSIESKPFFNYLMSDSNLLSFLFSISFKYLEHSFNLRCLLNLMISMNDNLLKAFTKRVTPNLVIEYGIVYGVLEIKTVSDEDKPMNSKEEEDLELVKNLEYLFKSLKESEFQFFEGLGTFDDNVLETTYQKPQKKLGFAKLTQVEYNRSILDVIINANAIGVLSKEIEELILIMKEKGIIFFTFEYNNMFQTFFRQIIDIVTNEFSPETLVSGFFIEGGTKQRKFISLLINHCYNCNKSKIVQQPTLSGFFPTEIKLLNTILNSKNKYIQILVNEDKDINIFVDVFAKQINSLFEQKLLLSESSNFSTNFNMDTDDKPYEPQEKTLEEILSQNKNIYKVYKEGGDYKKLLAEKEEEEKKLQEEKEKDNLATSIPLSDEDPQDNNVFTEEGKNFKDYHFFADDNDKPKEYERFKEEELKEIITIKAKEKNKEKRG